MGIQYKYTQNGDVDERYRCKSLAAIFNYFRIVGKEITITNKEELLNFITNDRDYSIEHFIIPNNQNSAILIECHTEGSYTLPREIRRYKNSIFNFIFIDKDKNNELNSQNLVNKISLLETYQFKCQYSKKVYEILKCIIKENDSIQQLKTNISNEKLDDFFKEKFIDLYLKYVEKIFLEIAKKFNSNKNE